MRLKRQNVYGWMPLIVLFTAVMACKVADPVVARIDGKGRITLNELNETLSKNLLRQNGQKPTLSEATENLNFLIDQKVFVLAAYDQKLFRDSSIVAMVEFRKQNVMLQVLFNKLIIEPVVKESDIRQFYANMSKDVTIRTIFFQLAPDAPLAEEKQVRQKADSVLNRLKSGESFSELARFFSEDKTTALNGGLVGTLSWTRSDDPIRKAAFSMREGQYSGLIRNNQGLNIIMLEGIEKKERKPLKAVHDEIYNRLARERGSMIRELRGKNELKMREQQKYQWQDSAVDTLIQYLKRRNLTCRTDLFLALDSLSREKKKTVLLQYRKGKFTIADFEEKAKKKMGEEIERTSSVRLVKALVERWLFVDQLLEMAKARHLDRDAEVMKQVRQSLEDVMVDRLVSREVNQKVDPSPERIREFYEKEKSTRYAEPERIRSQEIQPSSKKPAVIKPFDQIRETVAQDYINAKRQELRSAFLADQKKKFGGVEIFTEILEKNFKTNLE
jgi:parvulin-like peptidyl-prolyl isomerase